LEEETMLTGLLGTKVGMTQIFDAERNVIPVTVVNVGNWYILQIKKKEVDGYSAVQLGLARKRYRSRGFEQEWMKSKKKFFVHVREVSIDASQEEEFAVGKLVTFDDVAIADNDKVVVSGVSKGLGFQGVVKRWGFAGGPKSHGSTFHRKPGSIGNMCSQGNVIKGKKLPGHCGCDRTTVKGLRIAKIDKASGCLFVKGALPGKKESLLLLRKQG
jgi:large subunit ribosomal protein L3